MASSSNCFDVTILVRHDQARYWVHWRRALARTVARRVSRAGSSKSAMKKIFQPIVSPLETGP